MPRYAATEGAPFAADVVVDPSASAAAVKPLLSSVDGLVIGQDVAPAEVRALLDAAASASVPHVVLLSSATVYGAWSDNPVPLSEDATLRPNPGFAFAADRAEAERLVADWVDGHPAATATVLRPTCLVRGDATMSDFDLALSATGGLRPAEASRPVQFLAESDLTSAITLALEQRLEGPFNVAPDGWTPDETARALAGGPTRFPLPERVARVLRALSPRQPKQWPGLDTYTRHPWVIANDKLRAAGWTPEHTNEEAFVDVAAKRWPEIPARRRQELALGVSAALIVGAVAGVVLLVRRRRRNRA